MRFAKVTMDGWVVVEGFLGVASFADTPRQELLLFSFTRLGEAELWSR
jgi:hypothetical protein